MSWSAQQYVKFEDERTRPVRDLVAAVPTVRAARAADLGCGPGNSTEVLLQRFPGAAVTGVDSSPDMIRDARKRLPDVAFEMVDIAAWRPSERYDVILANAVLHWVPDHATLFPRLVSCLAPGGSLAVQMPDNVAEPCQVLMREVAASGPWAARLAGAAEERTEVASAVQYYAMLRPHCARVYVWRTIYHHPLAGAAAVVEWFKGSSLRSYLGRLAGGEKDDYVARYQAAVARAYPIQADGTLLLPFPRLFIVATR